MWRLGRKTSKFACVCTSMCMCVCVCACVCACVYRCVCARCTHVCVRVCTCVCVSLCVREHNPLCVKYPYNCVCASTRKVARLMDVRALCAILRHTRIHMCANTHIRTYHAPSPDTHILRPSPPPPLSPPHEKNSSRMCACTHAHTHKYPHVPSCAQKHKHTQARTRRTCCVETLLPIIRVSLGLDGLG